MGHLRPRAWLAAGGRRTARGEPAHLVAPVVSAFGSRSRSGSWGSFLTGDQSGDRGKDRVEMLTSAEVARQSPPVLQVADAVLRADPLGRVSPAFGLIAARADGTGSWFFRRCGRGVMTAPPVWVLRPW